MSWLTSVYARFTAALIIPVVALLVAGGIITEGVRDDARQADHVRAVVAVLPAIDTAVMALSSESTAALVGGETFKSAVDSTDEAIAVLNNTYDQTRDKVSDEVADQVEQIQAEGPGARAQLRAAVQSGALPAPTILNLYDQTIAPVAGLPNLLAVEIRDRELAHTLTSVATLEGLNSALFREVGVSRWAIGSGPDMADPQRLGLLEAESLTEAYARSEAAAALVSGRAPALSSDTLATHRATRNRLQLPSLLTPVESEAWEATLATQSEEVDSLRRDAATRLTQDAEIAAAHASRALVLTTTSLAAGTIAALLIAFLLARSLLRPLRKLARSAKRSRTQLEDLVAAAEAGKPVSAQEGLDDFDVDSRSEIGDLANAYRDTLRQALQLAIARATVLEAARRAVLAIARREQVLVNRQLGLLDKYERDELDPVYLARLFELDHLATLLRRNTNSLLLLTGGAAPQPKADPASMTDVLRSAVSSIEEYRRIDLLVSVDQLVVGRHVQPLAQLLAELLDNATRYSAPSTRVRVEVEGHRERMIVRVIDQGIGMAPDVVAQAFQRMAATSAELFERMDQLGFTVVGRLLSQLDASVRIEANPSGAGTIVSAQFGPMLFAAKNGAPGSWWPPIDERTYVNETSLPSRRAAHRRTTKESPSQHGLKDSAVAPGTRLATREEIDGRASSDIGRAFRSRLTPIEELQSEDTLTRRARDITLARQQGRALPPSME